MVLLRTKKNLAKKSTEFLFRAKFKKKFLVYANEINLHSFFLNKLTNCIMNSGKRSTAEKLVLSTFNLIRNYLFYNRDKLKLAHFKKDPFLVFRAALRNIIPIVGIKNYRGPQRTTFIIKYLAEYRRLRLALRWLHDTAVGKTINSSKRFLKTKKQNNKYTTKETAIVIRKQKKRPFAEMLALEVLKASLGLGKAILKKTELHKRAYSQRAYLRIKF